MNEPFPTEFKGRSLGDMSKKQLIKAMRKIWKRKTRAEDEIIVMGEYD